EKGALGEASRVVGMEEEVPAQGHDLARPLAPLRYDRMVGEREHRARVRGERGAHLCAPGPVLVFRGRKLRRIDVAVEAPVRREVHAKRSLDREQAAESLRGIPSGKVDDDPTAR